MEKVFHRSLFIDGPAGKLESLLWTPKTSEPAMAALVCHPHPLYGGTMHAFTNPKANNPSFGTVYKEIAANRAYRSIENFLGEVFS